MTGSHEVRGSIPLGSIHVYDEDLYRTGQSATSLRHSKKAQRLNPESWNY